MRLRSLITCAGITKPGYFHERTDDDMQRQLDVNYFGTVWAVRAALTDLRARRGSTITCMSSAAGLLGVFGYGAYCPSKFAVRGLTEVLRQEYKADGVTVTTVCPPDADTPMLRGEQPLKPPELLALSNGAKPLTAEQVARPARGHGVRKGERHPGGEHQAHRDRLRRGAVAGGALHGLAHRQGTAQGYCRHVRVGVVLLPEHEWTIDRARWQRAEELGFHTAWTYDHLAWRTMADGPWHATIPTLVAAALSTSTIRLGTLVASPNLRHPVPFAKDLMTLDSMSQGRLTVAIGAGTAGHDASVLGWPQLDPRRRADRFEEFVDLLGLLLSQPVTDWSGEYYSAVDARMIPGCVQQPRPPFVVAANGPRGMRLAQSRAEGWVTNGPSHQGFSTEEWWASVGAAVGSFDALAAERESPLAAGYVRLLNIEEAVGRATSVAEIVDVIARAASLGFTDVVLAWPRPTPPYQGDEAWMEGLAAELPALHDL